MLQRAYVRFYLNDSCNFSYKQQTQRSVNQTNHMLIILNWLNFNTPVARSNQDKMISKQEGRLISYGELRNLNTKKYCAVHSKERESITKNNRKFNTFEFTLNMRTRLTNIKFKANSIRYTINIHFEWKYCYYKLKMLGQKRRKKYIYCNRKWTHAVYYNMHRA